MSIRLAYHASLVANVALIAVLTGRMVLPTSSREIQPVQSRTGTAKARAAAVSNPGSARAETVPAEPRDIVAMMRAEGYPMLALRGAAKAAVGLKFAPQTSAISAERKAGQKRWQPNRPMPAELLERQRRLGVAMRNERDALLLEIEASGDTAAAMTQEKVARLRQLEVDFNSAASRARVAGSLKPEQQIELTRDFDRALAEILDPAEAAAYLRMKSFTFLPPLSSNLQSAAVALGMGSEEFGELLKSAREGDRQAAAGELPRNAVVSATHQKYHAILGDSRFLDLAGQLDPFFAGADSIYASAGVSAAQRARLYHAAREALLGGAEPSGSGAERVYRQLIADSGLGGQAQEAFDSTALGRRLKTLINTQP